MHVPPSKTKAHWIVTMFTELCYYKEVLLIMAMITYWLANNILLILVNPSFSIIKTIYRHNVGKNSLLWCIWYIYICRLNPKKRVFQCKKLIIRATKFILYSLYITKNDLKFIYKAVIYITTTYLYNHIDENVFYFHWKMYSVLIGNGQIFIENKSTIDKLYHKNGLVTLILQILIHISFAYALTSPINYITASFATILAINGLEFSIEHLYCKQTLLRCQNANIIKNEFDQIFQRFYALSNGWNRKIYSL